MTAVFAPSQNNADLSHIIYRRRVTSYRGIAEEPPKVTNLRSYIKCVTENAVFKVSCRLELVTQNDSFWNQIEAPKIKTVFNAC